MLIILNGISRKRRKFYNRILPRLEEFKPTLEVTEYDGHARAIATAASLRGEKLILAAGGDGTISQVVNGIMSSGVNELPALGIIPLGSGNDFARTLKITSDAKEVAERVRKYERRLIDVGVVELKDEKDQLVSKFFINECSIGMGPEVVRRMGRGSGLLGASLTYIKSIIETFFTHQPQHVHLKSDDFSWGGDARVVAIANGKAFGHALYIAPDAKLDDGLLNVFVCKGIPLVKFLMYLQKIKKPKKINDLQWIDYRTTSKVELSSGGVDLPVEADGELIGFTPFTCTLMHKSISILA
jgi:diacylglycerol kinase (ATP)